MTIRKSIKIERSPEISFKVFCEEMSQWWPGGFGGKESKPFLEGRVGGRLFERNPEGAEYEIGRVTAFQPPSLVAFTWRAPSWDLRRRSRFALSRKTAELVSSWNTADGIRMRKPARLERVTRTAGISC